MFQTKRKKELFQAAEKNGMRTESIRFVHPRKENPPNLVLVSFSFSPERENVMPAFILYDEEGNYTAETEEMFRGRRKRG